MTPETNRIYQGDCIDVMALWPENFVDTILTDPPYGLSFMGKDWDHGVPGAHFWAEALRIAKPGAMLLAFGGTRTYHRLAVAIEDAGWEIRDCLMWLYGSGFPKSLDISKAIDKAKGAEREVIGQKTYAGPAGNGASFGVGNLTESDHKRDLSAPATDLAKQWNGWGTALKPAWEPIILAMKPTDGTFAENAEKWGVAGMNIDGSRIEGPMDGTWGAKQKSSIGYGGTEITEYRTQMPSGRWPANLLLDEESAAMLDGQSGVSKSTGGLTETFSKEIYGRFQPKLRANAGGLGDSGGASRFFYVAKADRAERNEGCEGMPTRASGAYGEFAGDGRGRQTEHQPAPNHHPTVKPLSLMKYLCNLTRTPTGGIVLDPFCGSGTTLWAAESHNRPWIGIELNPEYVAIAKARIAKERTQLKLAI